MLSPSAPLHPTKRIGSGIVSRLEEAATTQSRIPRVGASAHLRKPTSPRQSARRVLKHQTETTEVMNHDLSSETLRRERALTRESERVFTKLTTVTAKIQDPELRQRRRSRTCSPLSACGHSRGLPLPHWASIQQEAPMFQACRHSCKTNSSPPRGIREARR